MFGAAMFGYNGIVASNPTFAVPYIVLTVNASVSELLTGVDSVAATATFTTVTAESLTALDSIAYMLTTFPPASRTIGIMPPGEQFIAEKTPDEIDDWMLNWADRDLGSDIIVGSSWRVSPAGLTIGEPLPYYTQTFSVVWLSGGQAGVPYLVTNTVTTDGGRTLEESFVCNVVEANIATD